MTATMTLDHATGLTIDPDRYFNELQTLRSLANGVMFLDAQVRSEEERIRKEHAGLMFAFGNSSIVRPRLDALMPSFFHWFAISIPNLARLIGYVGAMESGTISKVDLETPDSFAKISGACTAYVTSVAEIADVVTWRNKVAAHLALTDPRKTKAGFDNIATLEATTVHPVTFSAGRFRVGELKLLRGVVGGQEHQSALPCWSITDVMEQLRSRYWPQTGTRTSGQ
jgi:hypothetical protein